MTTYSGLWKYDHVPQGKTYGNTASYEAAETHLTGLHVGDFGCGTTAFRNYHTGPYTGIDGSPGHADIIADLTTYQGDYEGVLLRHVADHNPDHWRQIIANAIASASIRCVIVTFIADMDQTKVIAWSKPDPEGRWPRGIPNVGFSTADIAAELTGYEYTTYQLPATGKLAQERLWVIETARG